MRKISLSLSLILFAVLLRSTAAYAAPALPATMPALGDGGATSLRALLAHGDAHHFWIARVAAVNKEASPYEQTQIMATGGFGDSWTLMPPISSRAVSMASDAGELYVVLGNGQCMIVDDQDIRLAPGLPQGGKIVAVGNDQDSLWAIMIPGVAATAPSSTRADRSGLEIPATLPSLATPPRHLVAYRLSSGTWVDPQELPFEPAEQLPMMSMTVADQLPVIAWQTPAGAIMVSALRDHQWSNPLKVASNPSGGDFKLLSVAGKPILWTSAQVDEAAGRPAGATTNPSTRPSAGSLHEGETFARIIPLPISGAPPAHGMQTIAVAFDRLRWLAGEGDQPPFEQDYKLDGHPDGAMNPVAPASGETIPLEPFVVAAMALVLLAAGAAMTQRTIPGPGSGSASGSGDGLSAGSGAKPDAAKPALAPLGVRLGAGLVDMAPFLALTAVGHRIAPQGIVAPGDEQLLWKISTLTLIAYIAHTLIAELICGQSLGKMLLGLRVVGVNGDTPTYTAVILRNLFRVVDIGLLFFPLLMVVFSPLHQRVGDLAAGTIVISKEPSPEPVVEQE